MLSALLAILLGALRLFGLTALGRALLRRRRAPWLTVPLALLAAGAALGAMYAVMLWLGWRNAALAVDALAMLLAIIFRGRQTAMEIRRLFAPLASLVRRNRSTRAVALAIAVIYLFAAVMPPRDTDALRYHLAHLAQIDAESRWAAVSIAHYAFPFAWQFGFLPFVHVGLPEGAQIVNLGVWVVAVAAIVGQRGHDRIGALGTLLLAAVCLAPIAIGTATTPTADAFAVLSAVVVASLLAGNTPETGGVGFGDATALGFAAWVAVGTRYQAFAIGIAASVVALLWLARSDRWVTLLGFVEGAVLALLLAAPYFLANAVRFGNPVWPLRSDDGLDYTATVGAFYTRSWHGALDLAELTRSVARLLTDRSAVPIPMLVFVAIVAACLVRSAAGRPSRRVAAFCALFLAVWALAQPMLYPRFAVYLAGPALLLALRHEDLLDGRPARYARRAVAGVLGLSALALGAYAIAGMASDVRTLATGGRAAVRASTWYYSVYAWLGENIAPDSRVLVIVRSGETYYLDREYRRADPGSSAELDWPSMRDGASLASRLADRRFGYVVYEPLDWARAPGGEAMMHAIADAVSRGGLVELKRFDLRLTRSRFRDASFPSTVVVYRVRPASGSGGKTIGLSVVRDSTPGNGRVVFEHHQPVFPFRASKNAPLALERH